MVAWTSVKNISAALAWVAQQKMVAGYITSEVLYSKALKDPLVRSSKVINVW